MTTLQSRLSFRSQLQSAVRTQAWDRPSDCTYSAVRSKLSADWIDDQFIKMLEAYRHTGGLLRGEELADIMAQRGCGDLATLARNIVSGAILNFEWKDTIWIPAFQLDRKSLSVSPGAQGVLRELDFIRDRWGVAQWLASPNGWLLGRIPVDVLEENQQAVLDAARADRFIVEG